MQTATLEKTREGIEGAITTAYGYDHNDQRVFKTASTTTVYPNQYYETQGATTTKYVFADDELLAYIEDNGATTTTYYIHSDHLGSTQVVTDDSATVQRSTDYYPYGSQRIDSGDATLSRGYIGQFEDDDNMSYLNARYYKSDRGQFMSQDPVFWEIGQSEDGIKALLDPQSQNSYSYARNNPLINKDPEGRYWETAFDVAMLAWSLNDYKENPSFLNGLGVAADGASVLLPIPAVVGGLRHGDEAIRAARIVQDASRQYNWGRSYTLVKHTVDHAADFGLKSNDYAGYAKAANNFISRADTAFQKGSTRYDSFAGTGRNTGKTYFFDRKTSTYGVRNADGTTATAYKPKGGDPVKAEKYWNNKKKSGG